MTIQSSTSISVRFALGALLLLGGRAWGEAPEPGGKCVPLPAGATFRLDFQGAVTLRDLGGFLQAALCVPVALPDDGGKPLRIRSREPLTRPEALRLIRAALASVGYSLVEGKGQLAIVPEVTSIDAPMTLALRPRKVTAEALTRALQPLKSAAGRVEAGAGGLVIVTDDRARISAMCDAAIALDGAGTPICDTREVTGSEARAAWEQALERGIRCVEHRCAITEELRDSILGDTTNLATDARFVPSVTNGKPDGLKVYGIRRSGLFARLGLENGDTLKGINDAPLDNPERALEAYARVRSAHHLTVQLVRHGQPLQIEIEVTGAGSAR